jgi:hypothetical protein
LHESLQGQSHEKVGVMRVWGVSPGPNKEQILDFILFLFFPLIPLNFQSFDFAY